MTEIVVIQITPEISEIVSDACMSSLLTPMCLFKVIHCIIERAKERSVANIKCIYK